MFPVAPRSKVHSSRPQRRQGPVPPRPGRPVAGCLRRLHDAGAPGLRLPARDFVELVGRALLPHHHPAATPCGGCWATVRTPTRTGCMRRLRPPRQPASPVGRTDRERWMRAVAETVRGRLATATGVPPRRVARLVLVRLAVVHVTAIGSRRPAHRGPARVPGPRPRLRLLRRPPAAVPLPMTGLARLPAQRPPRSSSTATAPRSRCASTSTPTASRSLTVTATGQPNPARVRHHQRPQVRPVGRSR